MKKLYLCLTSVLIFSTSFIFCNKETRSTSFAGAADKTGLITGKMKIIIGNHTFTASLYDNATTTAFKASLPLTAHMVEFNGNEKYFDLPHSLPVNASNPGTIHNGDLMIYGSSTLVLFYKGFNTSYSYTRLGRVDDVKGLADALGNADVIVKFE